ncbi:hypothetical protein D3C86_1153000 [compost metagenome]
MQEIDRQECQEHRDGNDDHGRRCAGIHDEQGEHHHVPHHRKAGEEIFVRLHAHIGIIDGAGHHDHAGRHEGQRLADHAALVKRKGGQEHICDVVDDIVERIAGPVGQNFLHPHLTGDGSVDTIDQKRKPQPPEHVDETVFSRGNDAEKGQKRTGSREHMNGKGADFRVGNTLVVENFHGQRLRPVFSSALLIPVCGHSPRFATGSIRLS